MNLPFGGYGILGVCNDSAAFIDFALRRETNMYPLISTGRFLFHTGRRLLQLKERLCKRQKKRQPNDGDGIGTTVDVEHAIHDVERLVWAACNMDSDIHCSPSNLLGAKRRYNVNFPVSYFQVTEDSKQLMTTLGELYEDHIHA